MKDVRNFPEDRAAIIMGASGQVTTYGAIDRSASRGAHLFRRLGLSSGDVVAICMENCPEFLVVACAAHRCGLTIVPVSARLTAPEVNFILTNSSASVVIVSDGIDADPALLTSDTRPREVFSIGSARSSCRNWTAECSALPDTPIEGETMGSEMLYSSGTTGRPKGIVHLGDSSGTSGASDSGVAFIRSLGVSGAFSYLSPAPLYHSAPFSWSLAALRLGGTVVLMERFDAEQALHLIEAYRIDIAQWVPTHFVRMLKLPEEVRAKYDVSSLKVAIHAAAPCPMAIKYAMIEWWGPILLEYYGSSEQTALTIITSEEWLKHPGSVGRCLRGRIYICDEEGNPLPAGETGLVYADAGMTFSYRGDEGKTAASRNKAGWTTVGDVGRLDEEGYLYLTDRRDFMIISGGVNIYPQEVENALVTHPKIADVAVIGLPDADLGKIVTAVVQLADEKDATPEFAEELLQWMRQTLSRVKAPKRIIFRRELPRLPTGKMAKHKLYEEILNAG